MGKLTLREAEKAFEVSRPTLMKALKKGEISGDRDARGVWYIDPSELVRVYKARSIPPVKEQERLTDTNTSDEAFYKGRAEALQTYIDDLRQQRDEAQSRADRADARVTALLEARISPTAPPPGFFRRFFGG